ncbi:hypothetical protein ACFE04_019508 [Oxalis oulophora]
MHRGSPTSPNSPLPVSPAGLHTMYQTTRSELQSYRVETNRLFVRLINAFGRNEIQSCVLADPPLMTLYEGFLHADQRAANISSAQDVVIISGDSSQQPANSFGSVSGGGISDASRPSHHQTAGPSDQLTARANTTEPARASDHNELASAGDIV